MTVATTVEVTMPQLGETVAEGTVTAWLKQVGDQVEQDEALVEIATDKVDTEVPSPASGVVRQLLVEVDQTVLVGTPIALLDVGVGAVLAAPAATGEPNATTARTQAAPMASSGEPLSSHLPRHRASPRVRRQAGERGVDLGTIVGTGPGGRVTLADLPESGELGTERRTAPEEDQAADGPSAVAGLAGVVTVDIELPTTHADRWEMLAALAVDALAELRRYAPVRDVLVSTSDGDVGITGAADLTPRAVAARLAGSRMERVTAALRVVDAGEVLSQIVAPRGDEAAVLTIGRVTERLVPRGQATFALRQAVTVTLAYTTAISDADARAVLVALDATLATAVG